MQRLTRFSLTQCVAPLWRSVLYMLVQAYVWILLNLIHFPRHVKVSTSDWSRDKNFGLGLDDLVLFNITAFSHCLLATDYCVYCTRARSERTRFVILWLIHGTLNANNNNNNNNNQRLSEMIVWSRVLSTEGGLQRYRPSVRLSVCHTPVLYQNG